MLICGDKSSHFTEKTCCSFDDGVLEWLWLYLSCHYLFITMGLQFWKRNSEDPLAKLFFDRYKLNLLSIPREKVSVCDVYMGDTNKHQKLLSSPGSAINFLEPKFEIPKIITEDLTDIYNTTSDAISANVALDFLEGFLNILSGGGSFGTKMRGNYEQKDTRLIKLRFDSAIQDSIDRYLLGDNLSGHKIKEGNAAIIPGRNYYIVTAVARSSSISITAEAENNKKVNFEAEASKIASGTVSVSTENSREGELTFKGDKRLAFGVELCQLTYDTQNQQFSLPPVTESFKVRGDNNITRTRKVVRPTFIGDPIRGDMFIDIV